MFVFPAELDDGKKFFAEAWPEARAVSDPRALLFALFGVSRASLRELFGPGMWMRVYQARKKGNRIGGIIGNPWLLPGVFVVKGARVLWSWEFQNIGDHPDFAEIPSRVRRLTENGAGTY